MPRKPTRRQLSYLRSLADRSGQTFTYPQTAAQACREINRLKHTKAPSRTERKQVADQIATGPADDARVGEHEISGHGSSATWAHDRYQEPTATEDRPTARRVTPVVGKRTELARYQLADGERIIYGRRVDGIVRVTDRPTSRAGRRSYLVERGLDTNGELQALVSEYLAQAAKLGRPPLSISPLDSTLEAKA